MLFECKGLLHEAQLSPGFALRARGLLQKGQKMLMEGFLSESLLGIGVFV
jgi:hypothetical protein